MTSLESMCSPQPLGDCKWPLRGYLGQGEGLRSASSRLRVAAAADRKSTRNGSLP